MEQDRLEILPSLTKDYILSKISQEQIFEYYLHLKVETGYLMKSPSYIRTGDEDPTFSFYYSSNGKLRAQDFAGYFHGDCFDIVAYGLRLNANDKKSFAVILNKIARDFRLHKYQDSNFIESGRTTDNRETVKPRTKTIIEFSPREWNKIDANFWWSGNIDRKMLSVGRVYPCERVFVNSQLVYEFLPKDPAYAYYFAPNEVKIYFPFRINYRFLSNTSYLQGIDILEPDEIGIITKSYKDVLSMKSFSVQAVAPSSEVVPVSKDDWLKLRYTCSHWFTLMDYDRTGIRMARKLRDMYGIQPLFFSRYTPLNKQWKDREGNTHSGKYIGLDLTKNYEGFTSVKDFFDYVKYYGKDSTVKLINKTKEQFQERFDEYDIEMFDKLNWLKTQNIALC